MAPWSLISHSLASAMCLTFMPISSPAHVMLMTQPRAQHQPQPSLCPHQTHLGVVCHHAHCASSARVLCSQLIMSPDAISTPSISRERRDEERGRPYLGSWPSTQSLTHLMYQSHGCSICMLGEFCAGDGPAPHPQPSHMSLNTQFQLWAWVQPPSVTHQQFPPQHRMCLGRLARALTVCQTQWNSSPQTSALVDWRK